MRRIVPLKQIQNRGKLLTAISLIELAALTTPSRHFRMMG